MSSRRVACRLCGEVVEGGPEQRSNWTHSHPSICVGRNDRRESINGVHVGDLWVYRHVGRVVRVTELRAGGSGTYTDREPTVVTVDVFDTREDGHLVEQPVLFGEAELPPLEVLEQLPAREQAWWRDGQPLWSLNENADPLTRPGERPMPLGPTHWGTGTVSEWRGPGYRHPDEPEKDEQPHAYWHAWHVVRGYCIEGWECWQVDADTGEQIRRPPYDNDVRRSREAEQLALHA